jgi:hypothetical protein
MRGIFDPREGLVEYVVVGVLVWALVCGFFWLRYGPPTKRQAMKNRVKEERERARLRREVAAELDAEEEARRRRRGV